MPCSASVNHPAFQAQERGVAVRRMLPKAASVRRQSALLLRLLGAEDSAIYADYLYTNTALSHELEEAQSAALALSGDERAANYVLGFFTACPCWLAAALDTLDKRFYSIEGYIAQMTKVTGWEAEEFKRICIEKSPD